MEELPTGIHFFLQMLKKRRIWQPSPIKKPRLVAAVFSFLLRSGLEAPQIPEFQITTYT